MGNAMQGIEGAIVDLYVESFATEYCKDGEQGIMDYDSDVQVVGSLLPTQNSVVVGATQQQETIRQAGEFVTHGDDTT